MGFKNSHLINAARAAQDAGDEAEWERLGKLIDKSQEECPHPADQHKAVRRGSKGWVKCMWCSKKLADLERSPTGRMQHSEPRLQNIPVPETPTGRRVKRAIQRLNIREEALSLARDLDDEWQCSGGLKHWTDEEKRSYIKRAADLASLVKEILRNG
jgi:hypothetical protein